MARKKKVLFGANENPTNDLNSNAYMAAEPGFPIQFGQGEYTDGVFESIKSKEDSKLRFVYGAEGGSGAIFLGKDLVSSKILNIEKEDVDAGTTTIVVTFIGTSGAVETLDFSVVNPEQLDRIAQLEEWAAGTVVEEAENGAITVTPSNDNLFPTYKLGVNVDDETIKIVDDKLTATIASYEIVKVDDSETDPQFSSQYKLMITAPGQEPVQAGDTINIFKDFVLKSAHVCTFNKNADGSPYEITDEQPIGDIEVYAIVQDEEYADIIVEYEGETLFLEKAPLNKGLFVNHTYLHLIVNTKREEDTEIEGTDVFLDFSEIIKGGVFAELTEKVNNHEERISAIEESYIKEIDIPDSVDGEQFKTITVATSTPDGIIDSSFVIADTAYYDTVASNFETINNTLTTALTWQGLE